MLCPPRCAWEGAVSTNINSEVTSAVSRLPLGQQAQVLQSIDMVAVQRTSCVSPARRPDARAETVAAGCVRACLASHQPPAMREDTHVLSRQPVSNSRWQDAGTAVNPMQSWEPP